MWGDSFANLIFSAQVGFETREQYWELIPGGKEKPSKMCCLISYGHCMWEAGVAPQHIAILTICFQKWAAYPHF